MSAHEYVSANLPFHTGADSRNFAFVGSIMPTKFHYRLMLDDFLNLQFFESAEEADDRRASGPVLNAWWHTSGLAGGDTQRSPAVADSRRIGGALQPLAPPSLLRTRRPAALRLEVGVCPFLCKSCPALMRRLCCRFRPQRQAGQKDFSACFLHCSQ